MKSEFNPINCDKPIRFRQTYIFRRWNVIQNGIDGLLRMVSGDRTLDVCEQLFVAHHHFGVVQQLEIDFDHLFERLEAPFPFLAIFQIEHLLKRLEGGLWFIFFQRFTIVILIFQIDIWLWIAVFRVFLLCANEREKKKWKISFWLNNGGYGDAAESCSIHSPDHSLLHRRTWNRHFPQNQTFSDWFEMIHQIYFASTFGDGNFLYFSSFTKHNVVVDWDANECDGKKIINTETTESQMPTVPRWQHSRTLALPQWHMSIGVTLVSCSQQQRNPITSFGEILMFFGKTVDCWTRKQRRKYWMKEGYCGER